MNSMLKTRGYICGIGIAISFALWGCVDQKPSETEDRMPNIVIILADDLGYGDISALNPDSKIPTPFIDRIINEGMYFTDMHSNSAVCTPTRYGLLTGRYAWRTRLTSGVLGGYSMPLIEEGRSTIGDLAQKNGYTTACIGKWHLGLEFISQDSTQAYYTNGPWHDVREPGIAFNKGIIDGPNEHGFDYSFIIPSSLDIPPYFYIENHNILGIPASWTEGKSQEKDGRGVFIRSGIVGSDFVFDKVLETLTQKSMDFIERYSRTPEPFLLYFPLTAPHTPWLPNSTFEGTSAAGKYGDFVVQVDEMVGKIYSTLAITGELNNTLFIVTSDNGADWRPSDKNAFGHQANFQFKGRKADIWEAGHRIPFIARWPEKIVAGSKQAGLACMTDIYSSLAALFESPMSPNEAEDSFNLLPMLYDADAPSSRKHIINHSLGGVFAYRSPDWKYIPHRGSGGFSEPKNYKPKPGEAQGQLYHLAEDIAEEHNLYQSRTDLVNTFDSLLTRIQSEHSTRSME